MLPIATRLQCLFIGRGALAPWLRNLIGPGCFFVSLAEAVARVRYREGAILLRRELNPVGHAIMCRRRWRAWSSLRRRHRSNGHDGLRVIDGVGDEHSRLRVLL